MFQLSLMVILVSAIALAGVRRLSLMRLCLTLQAWAIGALCLNTGYLQQEPHYYLLALMTILFKGIGIPLVLKGFEAHIRTNRETVLIISALWSYVLAGLGILFATGTFDYLPNPLFKTGLALVLVGIMLMVGRRMAYSQMVGFLCLENGIVLFEIAMVELSLIVTVGILFEILLLSFIMGMLLYQMTDLFKSTDTSRLSKLKE